MSRRSPFRRITAALSSALLLQLSLLGSGTLCPMHRGQGVSAAGAHVHAMSHAAGAEAMDHAAMARAGVGTRAAAAPDSPDGPCGDGHSCNAPWTPGACSSMGGCGLAAAAPAAVRIAIVTSSHTPAAGAAAVLLPPGPSYAPELPPPRA